MFLAIVFIVLGIFLLLNAMNIILSANFWTFFWAVVFIALGIKMMMKKGCPMCGWHHMQGKMNGHCCDHDHDGEDHH